MYTVAVGPELSLLSLVAWNFLPHVTLTDEMDETNGWQPPLWQPLPELLGLAASAPVPRPRKLVGRSRPRGPTQTHRCKNPGAKL
jgi:hypothetical protein